MLRECNIQKFLKYNTDEIKWHCWIKVAVLFYFGVANGCTGTRFSRRCISIPVPVSYFSGLKMQCPLKLT